MKLRKTDKRFKLYRYGFDCYIEFRDNDRQSYDRYLYYCRKTFRDEYRHYTNSLGRWKNVYRYRNKQGVETKRIYFRGEKYYTLLLMTMPSEDNKTLYL